MKFLLCVLAAGLASAQVPFDRILNAASEPGNWLTYSGNYEAHRFSPLGELTPSNVAGLKPVWVYQMREWGSVETSPLVFDGVMYITEPPAGVTALDVRTGRPLWTWERPLPADLHTIGFGKVNRGVAALGGMLYIGTLDAHLVALDAKSGAVRWDAEVADH
jgi:alcohol dehydrogenase (cytochrome c)